MARNGLENIYKWFLGFLIPLITSLVVYDAIQLREHINSPGHIGSITLLHEQEKTILEFRNKIDKLVIDVPVLNSKNEAILEQLKDIKNILAKHAEGDKK